MVNTKCNKISRQGCSVKVLKQVEILTRYREPLVYARLQLAANSATTPNILIDLYRYTNDGRVKSIVRKRLTHILYNQQKKAKEDIKHIVNGIIFYPSWHFPIGFLQGRNEAIRPTQGKLYLNFAGRLAEGKNLILYLKTLELLHQNGIDFEAHVFGSAEPIVINRLHNEFWEKLEDPSLIDRIKYHGRYSPRELKQEVASMQEMGTPVFLFPKGLVSKELLSVGVPIITTKQGNWDIKETGLCPLDENTVEADLTNGVIPKKIKDHLESIQETREKSIKGKGLIQERYSLTSWGRQISRVIEAVRPNAKKVLLLGTTALGEPHGPAVWTENFLTYLRGTDLLGRYVYPYKDMQAITPIVNTSSNECLTAEIEDAIIEDLFTFTRLVMAISNKTTNLNLIEQAGNILMRLASKQGVFKVLSGQRAYHAFAAAVAESGNDPLELNYRALVFDEINFYGALIRPYLKIARWLSLLQTDLPETDVLITHGTLNPLLAIREKREKGSALIHVDHILASQKPLLRGITDNHIYTDTEKKWFINIITLARRMTFMYVDKYLALWPVNRRIAIQHYGMSEDKIVYIPNGINEQAADK